MAQPTKQVVDGRVILRDENGKLAGMVGKGAWNHPSLSMYAEIPTEKDPHADLTATTGDLRLGGTTDAPRETLTDFGTVTPAEPVGYVEQVSPSLANVATNGNRFRNPQDSTESRIVCADGFTVSIVAGFHTGCSPTPGTEDFPDDYAGPYSHVEVGFPSQRPEPFGNREHPHEWSYYESLESDEDGNAYSAPTETIYTNVPIAMAYNLIKAHGGEAR